MFTIVLVRPQHPGNVGAVARAMANFDMDRLIIIGSECDHLDQQARNRAKHAQHILDNAQCADRAILKTFDYVIGTTAQTGTDFNIARSPVELRAAAESVNRDANVAIVFGSEGTGLTNEELALCDYSITIQSSKKYGTLNLSHSVAIVLYELFRAEATVRHEPASLQDTKTIQRFFSQVLDGLAFTTPEKKETQKKVWHKIMAKAMLTKREAFAVLGFLRKLLE
jgi:TrmH family RNA methyltransferase